MVTHEVAGVVSELPWATADSVAVVVAFQGSQNSVVFCRTGAVPVLCSGSFHFSCSTPRLPWHQTQTLMVHSTKPVTTTPSPNLTFSNHYLQSRYQLLEPPQPGALAVGHPNTLSPISLAPFTVGVTFSSLGSALEAVNGSSTISAPLTFYL